MRQGWLTVRFSGEVVRDRRTTVTLFLVLRVTAMEGKVYASRFNVQDRCLFHRPVREVSFDHDYILLFVALSNGSRSCRA